MAKDPSVLLYTQDFLVGVSFLTPSQKGHYITLLCYQQQSETGSLTLEEIQAIMGGDFEKEWPIVQRKFKTDQFGFYNERMRKEIAKRKRFSESRSENRKKKAISQEQVNNTSSSLVQDINNICSSHEKHMENENENVNTGLKEEGAGETNQGAIVPEMVQQFLDLNPSYPVDRLQDFPAMRLVAVKIHEWLKLPGQITDSGNLDPIKRRWGEMAAYVKADPHLSTYSLTQINKYFQTIAQGLTGKHEPDRHRNIKTGKSAGAESLLAKTVALINAGGKQHPGS